MALKRTQNAEKIFRNHKVGPNIEKLGLLPAVLTLAMLRQWRKAKNWVQRFNLRVYMPDRERLKTWSAPKAKKL